MYDGLGGDFDGMDAHVRGLDDDNDSGSSAGCGGDLSGCFGCFSVGSLGCSAILLGVTALVGLALLVFFGWLIVAAIF